MNLFQSFKDLLAHGLVHTVHRLAQGAGQVLLGMQRTLDWLDGPHPVATRLKPVATFLARHPKRSPPPSAVACWPCWRCLRRGLAGS